MYEYYEDARELRDHLLQKYDYIEVKITFHWRTQRWSVLVGRAYSDILVTVDESADIEPILSLIGVRPKVQEDKTDGLSDSGGFSEPSSSFA